MGIASSFTDISSPAPRVSRIWAALLTGLVLCLAWVALTPGESVAAPVPSKVRMKPLGLKQGRVPITGKVRVVGRVMPWREGQKVTVRFFHDGRQIVQRRVKLRASGRNFGIFQSSIIAKKGGRYAAQAFFAGTGGADAVAPGKSLRKPWKVSFRALRYGECGRVISAFRRALNRLALVPAKGRCFNGKMSRAVLAYRKLNRMSRNAEASQSVVKRIFNGKGGYRVRKPGLGDHVEAPLSRQIIVFSRGSKPYAIFPIASGAPATPTILGTYRFYWKDPGFNEKGMYYSSYFIRGYAIHGYESVPNYPASHGCLRTFISDQPRIFGMTEIGMPIYTFGNAFRSASGSSEERWSTAGDLGPDLGPTGGLDPTV